MVKGLRDQTLVGAARSLLEGLHEEALTRDIAPGEFPTEKDHWFCQFCGAIFKNQTHSMDISMPDSWRGQHKDDCPFKIVRDILGGLEKERK